MKQEDKELLMKDLCMRLPYGVIVVEPHMYDYINEKNSSYVISLWQGDNYYENITSKDYPTYEDAVEVALKYALEKIIEL